MTELSIQKKDLLTAIQCAGIAPAINGSNWFYVCDVVDMLSGVSSEGAATPQAALWEGHMAGAWELSQINLRAGKDMKKVNRPMLHPFNAKMTFELI
ncbi:MAG: hypothetical protein AAFV29_22925, partial [Myxococcota bacterium]